MTRQSMIECLLSVVTFLWVMFLIFYLLFLVPYAGLDTFNGSVTHIYRSDGPQVLQPGDRILLVNGENFDKAFTGFELNSPRFAGYRPGDLVPLTIERGGQTLQVAYHFLGPNWDEFIDRLNGQWLIPVFFWLAGLMTLLFVRPQTQTSFLMSLFFYLTAFWLMAGIVSTMHVVWAAVAMRAAIWLTIPVYWHFLWYFPAPLGRLPKITVWGGYAAGIFLAAAQVALLLPPSLYLAGFTLALAGSLVLMVLHFILQRSERKSLAGLWIAALVILIPIIITSFLSSQYNGVIYGIVATTNFSALPGYFFLVLMSRQTMGQARLVRRVMKIYVIAIAAEVIISFLPVLMVQTHAEAFFAPGSYLVTFMVWSTMVIGFAPFLILPALARAEFRLPLDGKYPLVIRANRLAGDVFFFLVFFIAAGLLYLSINALIPPLWYSLASASASVGLIILAVFTRAPFQAFVQSKILGMPLHPDRLVKEYSSRILSSLDGPGLVNLLSHDILPSLLIRQSALLRISPRGEPALFLALRIEGERLPLSRADLALLEGLPGRQLYPADLPEGFAWVRLVVPLRVGERVGGLWLFGARDPDDLYSSSDIETLTILADQTALALSHIDQADSLRSLYLADGSRREAERLDFAAELHDAVLNPLAVLRSGAFAGEISPEFDGMLQDTIQHVRRVVKGLRPDMLNYGLYLGLQSLVDDLEMNIPRGGPDILIRLEPSPTRLDPQVELNLFRIVQQAFQNTLYHAQARTVSLSGLIREERVELCLEDDGQGFDFQGRIDLAELLAHHHYGLAGMYERAAVIGADLEIESRCGQGSKVQVVWTKK